jgi:hypothetical protein
LAFFSERHVAKSLVTSRAALRRECQGVAGPFGGRRWPAVAQLAQERFKPRRGQLCLGQQLAKRFGLPLNIRR